ncbi:MAG: hypothetical protein ABI758_02840 [Candidatus Woesebacteria bacterium]
MPEKSSENNGGKSSKNSNLFSRFISNFRRETEDNIDIDDDLSPIPETSRTPISIADVLEKISVHMDEIANTSETPTRNVLMYVVIDLDTADIVDIQWKRSHAPSNKFVPLPLFLKLKDGKPQRLFASDDIEAYYQQNERQSVNLESATDSLMLTVNKELGGAENYEPLSHRDLVKEIHDHVKKLEKKDRALPLHVRMRPDTGEITQLIWKNETNTFDSEGIFISLQIELRSSRVYAVTLSGEQDPLLLNNQDLLKSLSIKLQRITTDLSSPDLLFENRSPAPLRHIDARGNNPYEEAFEADLKAAFKEAVQKKRITAEVMRIVPKESKGNEPLTDEETIEATYALIQGNTVPSFKKGISSFYFIWSVDPENGRIVAVDYQSGSASSDTIPIQIKCLMDVDVFRKPAFKVQVFQIENTSNAERLEPRALVEFRKHFEDINGIARSSF